MTENELSAAEVASIVASADFAALQELIDSDSLQADSPQAIEIYNAIAADVALDIADRKRAALLAYLNDSGDTLAPDDVEPTRYDENQFDAGRGEYLVLTDSEADEKTAEQLADSLWAFSADFLAGETGIDSLVFKLLAEHSEGAQSAVESIVAATCGVDELCKAAAAADGRGHTLSGYDGEENESGEFFIYRVN